MKYRTISRTVEAMQLPDHPLIVGEADVKIREIAIWMLENGYEDPEEDPGSFDADDLHNGQVLPEYGVNFLTFKDEDGDEFSAKPGDWIVKGIEAWRVIDAVEFSHTYEQVES